MENHAADGEVDDGHLQQTHAVAADPAAGRDQNKPKPAEGDDGRERVQRRLERPWRVRVRVPVLHKTNRLSAELHDDPRRHQRLDDCFEFQKATRAGHHREAQQGVVGKTGFRGVQVVEPLQEKTVPRGDVRHDDVADDHGVARRQNRDGHDDGEKARHGFSEQLLAEFRDGVVGVHVLHVPRIKDAVDGAVNTDAHHHDAAARDDRGSWYGVRGILDLVPDVARVVVPGEVEDADAPVIVNEKCQS